MLTYCYIKIELSTKHQTCIEKRKGYPKMFIIINVPSVLLYNFEPGKNASTAFIKLSPIRSKASLEPLMLRSIPRSSVFIDCDSCAVTKKGSKSSTYGSNIFLASEVLFFFFFCNTFTLSRKTKTARISRSQPTCWPIIF